MNRFRLLTSALLAALVLSLTLGAGGARARQDVPARDPAPVTPAEVTPRAFLPITAQSYDRSYINPFGIVMYYNVDQAGGLGKMQAAKAARVTTFLDWGTIEPSQGVRNWASFDDKVRNARDAGMETFVLFTGDPAWAWVGPADNRSTDPVKRRDFVRAMVQRYDCDGVNDAPGQLCIRDWSFYAEPDYSRADLANTPGAKGYWGTRPQAYAQMLADVAVTVHLEDPTARVMIGGIAYDYFKSAACPSCPFIRTFLPDVLAELQRQPGGARSYIDALAIHYYPLSFPTIGAKVREIRGIMQTYGVGHLPLIVPEAGFWSEADSTESLQAQRLVQMYVEAIAVGVEHLSWYRVLDDPGGGRNTWGLFRGTDLNSPKPSYTAYQTMTRELTGARYARALGQAGVEGYVFITARDTEKTVVWTASAGGANATFSGSCARSTNVLGVSYGTVGDGSASDQDRAVNGRVVLRIPANDTLYVERCP